MAKRREETRPKEPDAQVAWWLEEIAAAKEREKDFRERGRKIIQVYSGAKSAETPFNILFSNTETMLPALYSAVPRPLVSPRFKSGASRASDSAMAGQRMLEYLLDTDIDGYETFDEAVGAAVLDALLPGRGVTSVKYDADIVPYEPYEDDGAEDEDEPSMRKASELVCLDSRRWDRVLFGYAAKWSKTPWIAYEDYIDRKEAERLFGREVANAIAYSKEEKGDDEGEKKPRLEGNRKMALVYQIWDKEGGRKIRYVSPNYPGGFLKVEDDPLGLTGFFNCPRPIRFIAKPSDQVPTALYVLYENQAAELNKITKRINVIVSAIKAKGLYDGALGEDLKKLMEADDTVFVATDSSSSLAADKGMDKTVWFWPVDKLIQVLLQLYQARNDAKQVIYEITGIADIMRGSSAASETLGAQQIKQSWGTLRLKRLQREVQRYARDLLRLMLEVAATKFSEETWAKVVDLPFATSDDRAKLEAIAQAGQAMMAAGAQPSPEQAQQLQQIQAELAKPAWADVLAALQDDQLRSYKIDIETNSTIEPEATEDQQSIAEMMNAMAQFLNGVGPLVAQGIMPFDAARAMLLAVTRRFRLGSEIEDQIKAMQAPQPKPESDGGAAAEAKVKQVEEAARIRETIKDAQHDLALKEAELKRRETVIALEKEVMQLRDAAAKASQSAEARVAKAARDRDTDAAISNMKAISDKVGSQIREFQLAATKAPGSVNKRDALDGLQKMHGEMIAAVNALTAAVHGTMRPMGM